MEFTSAVVAVLMLKYATSLLPGAAAGLGVALVSEVDQLLRWPQPPDPPSQYISAAKQDDPAVSANDADVMEIRKFLAHCAAFVLSFMTGEVDRRFVGGRGRARNQNF